MAADGVVEHRAELEPRDVLQRTSRAVGVRPDDDVAELLLVEQAALGADGVGVLGARAPRAARRSARPGVSWFCWLMALAMSGS